MRKSIHTKRYKLFLELLIQARLDAGITQLVLAEKLNKPQSFVAKYENAERRLDVAEFVIIAQELGIDPEIILRQIK